MEDLIQSIIEKEWELFHGVNGEQRVSCQNDRKTFVIMRRAQYQAWSREALELYAADLDATTAAGHSIVREKYIRMMRSTAPQTYAYFSAELPPVSAEKAELVSRIWTHLCAQTERMRKLYPCLALGGRPLYAREETDGWASVETYQTSELLTYSEATLRALAAHIEVLEAEGRDFAWLVQENTVLGLGFPDLETAERTMAKQMIDSMEMRAGGSTCCGGLKV